MFDLPDADSRDSADRLAAAAPGLVQVAAGGLVIHEIAAAANRDTLTVNALVRRA